jgi:hypothetical protein
MDPRAAPLLTDAADLSLLPNVADVGQIGRLAHFRAAGGCVALLRLFSGSALPPNQGIGGRLGQLKAQRL